LDKLKRQRNSALFEKQELSVSRFIVKQLTALTGFVQRKMKKSKTIKEVANRDEQFQKMTELKADFFNRGLPVLSIDTKKKEFIGQFYRAGKSYSQAAVEVFDHSWTSLAEGRVVPHGIYDLKLNKGYLSLGKSRDTAEFLSDNLKYHWQNNIRKEYPQAEEILLLMDGGGSNSSLHYIVKEDLQKLANELKMKITVAHYPPQKFQV